MLLSIEKEVAKVDENGKDHTKTMFYRLKFIDSTRSMESSLSNLVSNLAERIHKIKCKYMHYDKKCENYGIKYKDCDCFLKYTIFRDHLIEYKCLFCNKNYERKFDEILKKIFFYTYKFSNHDTNKFILLLRNDVYSYEYMDDWKKFSEIPLPEKKDFYSHLNMEDITDADYAHAKTVCRDFKIRNLGNYYDIYVQSNTLLLTDVFENFRNICLKIYELEPAHGFSAPELTWDAALKKPK